MKLKRNVVMLPTNGKAPIAQYRHGNKYLSLTTNTRNLEIFDDEEYRHLHITSDEEIKKGDWYIDDTNAVRQAVTSDDIYWKSRTDYKKIIATTDNLTFDDGYNSWFIPSPSDGFIKKFIERYNAGTPITEVMVEYEYESGYQTIDPILGMNPILKVDKNNYITITSVKDNFTRKEVLEAIKFAYNKAHAANDMAITFEDILAEFEQNL